MADVSEVVDDILKSPQDDREYRFLVLHNQLKVLIVSDTTTEKAAAALAVHVGYLSDPDDVPGLAHFCEHMLFLGTDKYPSENEYTQFLSHHGGSSNAYTSSEYTTYFFDVGSEHLHGALDRFAQFFICPLFNADAKDREVRAVDSENSKNLQEDQWRFSQVQKATSRPGHPYRKFGTGNLQTLETRPKELEVDVREELLRFHSTHYSSNLMTLVVLGRESLDELAGWVRGLFAPVVNKNLPVMEYSDHPFSNNELQALIEFVPVKDLRQLKVEFPLPDLMEYYNCDPTFYVSHLVGHEGPGSLLSLLKIKGWCTTLAAGATLGAKGYMFFDIGMTLTEEGEEHTEDIVRALFQYLAVVRHEGPQEWIFQEYAAMDAVKFRFKDKSKPRSYVQTLVRNLHNCKPRDVLSGSYLQTKFRPDLIQLVLDRLQPQHVRVAVVSKKFEGKTELTEPWYGAGYNYRKIDPRVIEEWSTTSLAEELHLPAVNEFIPTDFEIVPLGDSSLKVPTLIQDTPMSKVWYKQDDTFLYPKACLGFLLATPEAYRDPSSSIKCHVFLHLLKDALNEYTYYAEIAGVKYNVELNTYGILVEVTGYSHKQSTLLLKILSRMSQFSVEAKRFDVYKEMVLRDLKNFRAEQPYQHALFYNSLLLDSVAWTKEELTEALEALTPQQLQTFLASLFSRVHIEALIHGNVSKQSCLELMAMVEDTLRTNAGSQPLLPEELEKLRHQHLQIPDGSCYTYSAHNEVHNSSCVHLYLQTGLQDTPSNMLLELFSQIVREPCFDTLRTKEQLGYIVGSGTLRLNGAQGVRFIVQSDREPAFVEKRIEVFLQRAKDMLDSLTDEAFEKHKAALALKRLEKPKRLSEEYAKYRIELLSRQYHFNRDEEEIAYLRTHVTKENIMKFFQEFIAIEAPQRRKLTVQIIPLPKDASNDKVCSSTDEPSTAATHTVAGGSASTGETDSKDSTDGGQPGQGGGMDDTDFGVVLPEAVAVTDHSALKRDLTFYPLLKPYIPTSLS